jgi:hypothetical protein
MKLTIQMPVDLLDADALSGEDAREVVFFGMGR